MAKTLYHILSSGKINTQSLKIPEEKVQTLLVSNCKNQWPSLHPDLPCEQSAERDSNLH